MTQMSYNTLNRLKKAQIFKAIRSIIQKRRANDKILKDFTQNKIGRIFSAWKTKKSNCIRLKQLIKRIEGRNITQRLKQGVESFKRHSILMQKLLLR